MITTLRQCSAVLAVYLLPNNIPNCTPEEYNGRYTYACNARLCIDFQIPLDVASRPWKKRKISEPTWLGKSSSNSIIIVHQGLSLVAMFVTGYGQGERQHKRRMYAEGMGRRYISSLCPSHGLIHEEYDECERTRPHLPQCKLARVG